MRRSWNKMATEVQFSWNKANVSGACPSKRFGHGMAAVGNNVYVFGGGMNVDEDRVEYKNDLYLLSFDGDEPKWQKVAQKGELPQAREVHVFSPSDEGLVLFGGQGDDIDLSVINVFNPETSKWSKKIASGAPPQASSLRGLCTAGKLITFGGVQDSRAVNTIHCVDLENLVWEEVKTTGTPPLGRCDHAMVVVGDRLFVMAGSAGSDLYLNDLYMLSMVSWQWSKCDVSGDGPSPRDYPTLCNLEDQYLLMFGGFNGGEGEDQAFEDLRCVNLLGEEYSYSSVSFVNEGETPEGRFNHRTVMIDKKMVLFGGMSLEDDLSDVWILSPQFEVVDFCGASGPNIQYNLEVEIPQPLQKFEPEPPSNAVDLSSLEAMKGSLLEKIGQVFDVLAEQLQDLTVKQRTLQAEKEAFEVERDQHRQLYEAQQQELQSMLENHRLKTEQWIDDHRREVDSQKRGNEEMRVHMDKEATELQESRELFAEKSKKLDAIMKQVQGLTS